MFSYFRQAALSAGALSILISCMPVVKEPALDPSRDTVLQVGARDSKAQSAEELGERLTPGKGAAGGALAGVGATLEMNDPYAILLLPIFVPIGAVVGAASAPNDEEWAEKVAEHERKVANIAKLIPIVDGIEKAGRLERLIAEQFRVVPALAPTCVRTRAQGRNCPVTQATPRLTMEMGHKITMHKFTEGGLFSGKSKKTVEVYYIISDLDVRLDMPAPQEDRCYDFAFGTTIRPDETGGKIDRQVVEAALARSLEQVAVRLVLSVFEAPGRDRNARNALAKERQAEHGLKYTPYPQYPTKCG